MGLYFSLVVLCLYFVVLVNELYLTVLFHAEEVVSPTKSWWRKLKLEQKLRDKNSFYHLKLLSIYSYDTLKKFEIMNYI